MQNCSTKQQLLLFLSNAFNTRHQLDTVYLNISKAFDTVCHINSLHKLSTIHLISLENRFQFVLINNMCSTLLAIISGVPQGRTFAIYNIHERSSQCYPLEQSLPFCTDMTPNVLNISRVLKTSQHDLDNLSSWPTTSCLSFNSYKSIHISFNCKISASYNIRDIPINTTHSHKDLGIVTNDSLNWNFHYDAILSKVY